MVDIRLLLLLLSSSSRRHASSYQHTDLRHQNERMMRIEKRRKKIVRHFSPMYKARDRRHRLLTNFFLPRISIWYSCVYISIYICVCVEWYVG
jgi:hypothetical protein